MKKTIMLIVLLLIIPVATGCGSNTATETAVDKAVGETVIYDTDSDGLETTKNTTRVIEVTGKDVKTYRDSDGYPRSKYLVFTTTTTYEITDSILNMRFDSSDVYGQVRVGKCYEVEIDALSFRLPFLSMYENILDPTEIKCTNNITPPDGNI